LENNIDFKKIWKRQEIEIPKVENLYLEVNKLKKNSLLRLVLINVSVLIIIFFLGTIFYYIDSELVTTKIGIVITVLAMITFTVSLNKQLPLLYKNKSQDELNNNSKYLQELIKLKEKQIHQQTTVLSTYFILLSLGIGLYMIEFVLRMTISWGIITYTITIFWFAINWFYLRPMVIKKQNIKLNKLLNSFKKLNNQMADL